jgi:hypothetical protein
VVLLGIIIVIDHSNSKYTESELEYILANEINEIDEGEESTYQITDIYKSREMMIYSGVIILQGKKNPFLFGFEKSLIFPLYKPPRHIISYSSSYIERPKLSVDKFLHQYWLRQDEEHKVVINRKLNNKNIFQLGIVLILTMLTIIKRRND